MRQREKSSNLVCFRAIYNVHSKRCTSQVPLLRHRIGMRLSVDKIESQPPVERLRYVDHRNNYNSRSPAKAKPSSKSRIREHTIDLNGEILLEIKRKVIISFPCRTIHPGEACDAAGCACPDDSLLGARFHLRLHLRCRPGRQDPRR
jgi:hypothetical protein